jgi:hypothetical protein
MGVAVGIGSWVEGVVGTRVPCPQATTIDSMIRIPNRGRTDRQNDITTLQTMDICKDYTTGGAFVDSPEPQRYNEVSILFSTIKENRND